MPEPILFRRHAPIKVAAELGSVRQTLVVHQKPMDATLVSIGGVEWQQDLGRVVVQNGVGVREEGEHAGNQCVMLVLFPEFYPGRPNGWEKVLHLGALAFQTRKMCFLDFQGQ